MIQFVKNREIYERAILEMIPVAQDFVWIATADIKNMQVNGPGGFRPFLGVLDDLVREGVGVRLLHSKEPGPRFRKDFDLYPGLLGGLERILCPRVHLKTIVVDGKIAYLGSANLTGAGMGAKSKDRRNFEPASSPMSRSWSLQSWISLMKYGWVPAAIPASDESTAVIRLGKERHSREEMVVSVALLL